MYHPRIVLKLVVVSRFRTSVSTFALEGAEQGVRPYLWSAEPKPARKMPFLVQAAGGYGLSQLLAATHLAWPPR